MPSVSVKQAPRPEFSRPIGRERLVEIPFSECIRASAEERRALAERLELEDLKDLSAAFDLRAGPGAGLLEVRGRLEARVTQFCVVTLEPVDATLNESFEVVYCLDESPIGPSGEGMDQDSEDATIEVMDPEGMDLGELAAQYLSLALDPFPRKPGVRLKDVWGAEGDKDAPSPFAALESWRSDG